MTKTKTAVVLVVGDICLVRGGGILRYQGLYANKGPCLAFRSPLDPMGDVPVGASIAPSDVLRVLDESDLPWLQVRRDQAASRNLNAVTIETIAVIDELARKAA